MKLRPTSWFFSLLLLTLAGACKKDAPDSEQAGFDRAAMLEHYALNLIRPAYDNLLDAVFELETRWKTFSDDPDEAKLIAVREQWLETALAWQSANAFNFGPAGEEGLRKGLIEEIGTFPAATGKIEGYIAAGDTNLNNFDRDSRGLPAIEYLLYGNSGNIQDVLTALHNDNRRAYVAALIAHLYVEVGRAVTGWETYQSDFIANDGTDIGSATSQLYNEFVRSYEAAKNFKVALPAGKRAGQSQVEPQLVEAYYSGRSLDLLKAHLASIERIYYGRGLSGTDSPGFGDYLQAVTGGPALVSATETQWQAVKAALAQVPDSESFAGLIEQQDPTVDALYTEMQKQIRFFKSDMSSLLGIAITFNSGDGD